MEKILNADLKTHMDVLNNAKIAYKNYQKLYHNKQFKYKLFKCLKFSMLLLMVIALHISLFFLVKKSVQYTLDENVQDNTNSMQVQIQLQLVNDKKNNVNIKSVPINVTNSHKSKIKQNVKLEDKSKKLQQKNKHQINTNISPLITIKQNIAIKNKKNIEHMVNQQEKKQDIKIKFNDSIFTNTHAIPMLAEPLKLKVEKQSQINHQKQQNSVIHQNNDNETTTTTNSIGNINTNENHEKPNKAAEYLGEKPPYPSFAIENGIEGSVLVKCLIDEHGYIKEMMVEKSSGEVVLDQAAIAYYLKNRKIYFNPAIKNAVAIESWKIFRVKFSFN